MLHTAAMEPSRETSRWIEDNQSRMDSTVLMDPGPVRRPVNVNGARGPTGEDWSPSVMRQIRWLLAGLGLLAAVDAITSQIAYRQLVAAVDEFLRVAPDVGAVNGRFVVSTLSFSMATSIAVGVSMVVLAAVLIHALRRPSQRARVVAIAAMIALVLVQVVGIGANPNLFADPSVGITGELAAAWDALLPGWFVWTHYAVETAMLLAALAIGVKLSTTRASEFFALRHLVAADDRRLWSTEPVLAWSRRR